MQELFQDLITYIPRLLAAFLIIGAGGVLGAFARPGVTLLLRRLRFDQACDRVGLTSLMRDSGMSTTPSQFGGTVVFWAIVLFAVLAALGPLGLEFLATTLNQVILYAPRILAAALIIILGTTGARLLAELAERGLSEVGVSRTATLKALVRFGVIAVAAILAITVLGIDATILVVITVIALGAVALTASLALGLGLRGLSQDVAAGRYISEGIAEGDEISVNGFSGTVETIGYAMTTVRDPESGDIYLLPNSYFSQHVVTKRGSALGSNES